MGKFKGHIPFAFLVVSQSLSAVALHMATYTNVNRDCKLPEIYALLSADLTLASKQIFLHFIFLQQTVRKKQSESGCDASFSFFLLQFFLLLSTENKVAFF